MFALAFNYRGCVNSQETQRSSVVGRNTEAGSTPARDTQLQKAKD